MAFLYADSDTIGERLGRTKRLSAAVITIKHTRSINGPNKYLGKLDPVGVDHSSPRLGI